MASAFKYAMLVADFNAHHYAWGDGRIDHQGDLVLQVCDNYQMVLLKMTALLHLFRPPELLHPLLI